MNDISSWLEAHELEKYAAVFVENEITVAVLPELTEADLRELGLPMGPRKQLLRLIRELDLSSPGGEPFAEPGGDTPAQDAERRQLTIMFSDLVGSTELSQALDPEDLRTINRTYQDAAKAAVEGHGGFVARYMGDGVLAYFGYPSAGEDDAERAVMAGLELAKRVPTLVESRSLSVRVGIATGQVVVGDLIGEGASQEAAVVGETPNLAARLQGEAGSNQVIVSGATARLVDGYFELEALEERVLRGFAMPQKAWLANRPRDVGTRFEARHGQVSGQFIGRRSELALLDQRWETTCEGEGQVVLLNGEPGIGKSRISDEFRRNIERDAGETLRFQCTPHHTNSALYPFISRLQMAAGLSGESSGDAKLDRLEAAITCQGDERERALALFASMLGLPVDRYQELDLTPQKQKADTIRAICAELESLCAREPVLVLFEDAHWIDPTSREVLDILVSMAGDWRVMIVITHRPEFRGWSGYGHMTELTLNRLGRKDGVAVIMEMAGGKNLPEAIVGEILEKTDGVPLYLEELAKAVLEGGALTEEENAYVLARPLSTSVVPSSLRDSLMSRLDRLGPAKEIAQAGACIGREFRHDLLLEVVGAPDAVVAEALERLEDQQLLFRRGNPPNARYTFKHALIQDAAQSSLLRERRAVIHARIARALQGSFADLGRSRPELVARHLTEAGIVTEAIDSWLAAGRQSSGHSAHVEAEAHLENALELIATLPASEQRDEQELAVQTTLGPVLMATRGYGSSEVSATYERAREICQELQDDDGLFKAILGLRYARQIMGKTAAAREHGNQCLAIAQRTGDRIQLAQAHAMLAHTECLLGNFDAARQHARQVEAVHDASQHEVHVQLSGLDPGVFAKTVSSWTLWFLGYPDQALEHARQALVLATELDNPQSLEHAMSSAASTALLRREWRDARRQVELALALGSERGFKYRVCLARVVRSWVTSMEGGGIQAVTEIAAATNEFREIGGRAFLTYFLALEAEVCNKAGEVEKGLAAVEEGLQLAEAQAEYWWNAELLRLRGELELRDNRLQPAEASFNEAISVARGQQGKMWELRATCSLARVWAAHGRNQEAVELLQPIFDWFSEGFDTVDLRDAKDLLDSLG